MNLAEGLPPVFGPVEFEVSAVLTTAGELKLDGAVLQYEPARSAKLVGRSETTIPVADVARVSRRDGNRRLVIETDSGGEYVFRGLGAQRVWVALMAAAVPRARGALPPLVIEEEPFASGEVHGLYGLGTWEFGFSGRNVVGLVVGWWDPLEVLSEISVVDRTLRVRTGEERGLPGSGARIFASALGDRWLDAQPPSEDERGWGVPALRCLPGKLVCGRLSIEPEGVCFTPMDGAPEVVAPRGGLAVARSTPADTKLVHLDADDAVHVLRVYDAAATVTSLMGMFLSDAWRGERRFHTHEALSREDFAVLDGAAAESTIAHQGVTLAHGERQFLRPNPFDIEIEMYSTGIMPPEFPFLCELMVMSNRGRFAAQCLVAGFSALPSNPSRGPASPKHFYATLRFRGALRPIDRREHFRLSVDGNVYSAGIEMGRVHRVLRRELRLINVSRGGCRYRLPAAPDLGSICTIELGPAGRPVEISAVVVNVTKGDGALSEVGVRYTPESMRLGTRLFQELQSAFLRKRREGG